MHCAAHVTLTAPEQVDTASPEFYMPLVLGVLHAPSFGYWS